MSRYIRTVIPLLGLLAAAPSPAGEWDATGFAGIDGKAFLQDARYPDQQNDFNGSFLFQPELYWRGDNDRQRASFVGFGRIDSQDEEHTHADLREAYWGFEADTWDLVAGFNRVFWGVTESRHLVDVINQTDLVEDIDQEEKLGQPMINLNIQRDYGRFGLFVMPRFRERTFPGNEGRLRPPLPVDGNSPLYESSAGKHHNDLAVRYSHYFGDFDIGAHIFSGTSREPSFVLAGEGDRLLPFYQQMMQVGLDVQYTRDAWLWKFEAIGRDSGNDTFMAAVGGFEYTFYGVRGSAADVGMLAELLYDGRNDDSPPTVFENDLFVGTRLAFNDPGDSSVLAGFAIDLDTREMFLNVEAERRFGDNLSVELRLRAFGNTAPGDDFYSFERDDYLQLRLSWYY